MNAAQNITTLPEEPQPSLQAVEQAADWHVRLHAENVSEDDRAAFEAWCNQHPNHAEAYQRLEALWGKFDHVEAAPAIAALEKTLQRKSAKGKSSKLPVKSITFGMAFIMAGWLGMRTETAAYFMSDYSTTVGEQRVIELADHSRITLNTYSAIDVDFTGAQRRITLHKGEILVEVARDTARPFIVETSQGSARALGTSFVVKRENRATAVSVVESIVEACTAPSYFSNTPKQCVQLHAEQGTRITTDSIEPVGKIDIDTVSGWSAGMLAVEDRPLAEVLNELERYRSGRIYYNADAIANLRVSGVFPLNDTDRALEMLTGLLPIQTSQYTPILTVVRPR